MFLTCQQCAAKYRLDPGMLGVGGRMVRCTACGNVWFQPPEQVEEIAAGPQIPAEEDLLKQIGIGAEAPPQAPEDFRAALEEAGGIPDVVRPVSQKFDMPVMEYRPMGMGANQFGFFTFLLFAFATMIVLFALRGPVVNTFPVMASLYKVLGFQVKAPGEGLRLTEMIAENRVEDGKKKLAVEAKLTNISEHDMEYPALLVVLKGGYGKVLQDWDFRPGKTETLKSGDSVPVKLEFEDAAPEGKLVEMKVIEE